MYVIFPLICYNAARSVIATLGIAEALFHLKHGEREHQIITTAFKSLFVLTFIILSLARSLAQWRAYSAPMHIYSGISPDSSVCMGKEWYRFPSSFFIPDGCDAFFVKSEFNGLLPGKFPKSNSGMSRNGTWLVPAGMNDQNKEQLSHAVPHLPSLYVKSPGCSRFMRFYCGFRLPPEIRIRVHSSPLS
jgi:alpha-1,2-mannosyltransferase